MFLIPPGLFSSVTEQECVNDREMVIFRVIKKASDVRNRTAITAEWPSEVTCLGNCNVNIGLKGGSAQEVGSVPKGCLFPTPNICAPPLAEPLTESACRIKRVIAKMQSSKLPLAWESRGLFGAGKHHRAIHPALETRLTLGQPTCMPKSPKKQLKPGHFLSEEKGGNAIGKLEAGR